MTVFFPVVPRGKTLLSEYTSHSDWLQDWPEEGQGVCEETEGHESGSHHIRTGKNLHEKKKKK